MEASAVKLADSYLFWLELAALHILREKQKCHDGCF